MSKPICVRSTVFKVCQDELITELLRAFPVEKLDHALANAHAAARKRVDGEGRHARYKVLTFFKHMAERLPDMTPRLAVEVGLKSADQLDIPGVVVDEPDEPEQLDLHTEVPIARLKLTEEQLAQRGLIAEHFDDRPCLCHPLTKQPGILPCPKHSKTPATIVSVPAPPDSDEFAGMLDAMPTFEDYDAVFMSWPYVNDIEDPKTGERVTVLGYLSGRDEEDRLIRRNCEYEGKAFKSLQSNVGLLKKRLPNGSRLHIKVIPHKTGAKVRFWTNVAGVGDREKYNRYIVCGVDGLHDLPTRMEFDAA